MGLGGKTHQKMMVELHESGEHTVHEDEENVFSFWSTVCPVCYEDMQSKLVKNSRV